MPNRSGPDLVLGASARFICGNNFVRVEERRERHLAALGEFSGNSFQILFIETHGADLHFSIGFDQENGRNIGEAIGVGGRIPVFIQNERECDAVFRSKVFRYVGIVLGDAQEGCAAGTVALVKTFQEWEGKLADRAGDFEEGSDDWTALEQCAERIFLLVERFERKFGSHVAGNNVSHVVLRSHPA